MSSSGQHQSKSHQGGPDQHAWRLPRNDGGGGKRWRKRSAATQIWQNRGRGQEIHVAVEGARREKSDLFYLDYLPSCQGSRVDGDEVIGKGSGGATPGKQTTKGNNHRSNVEEKNLLLQR